MWPLWVQVVFRALGLIIIVYPSCSDGYRCSSGLQGLTCTHAKVCYPPETQITINFPGLGLHSVIRMSVTLNSSNTELYHDFAEIMCKRNETKEKRIEMVDDIAEKLGFNISSNVQKGPCDGTDYTLVTRNQSGCFIVNKCLKHVDKFKTNWVLVGANGEIYNNVTAEYDSHSSFLLCEIDRTGKQDYNTSSIRTGQSEENQGHNVAVIVVPTVFVILIIILVSFCLFWRRRKLKQEEAQLNMLNKSANGYLLPVQEMKTL